MFCPRCGKEIKNNQRFCTNCGYDCSQEVDGLKESDEFSYEHKSFYKKPLRKTDEFKKDFDASKYVTHSSLGSFGFMFKGILVTVLILAGLVGLNVVKKYFSTDLLGGINKARYENYMQNPSTIPELTQPDSLDSLIKNLKDTQTFLALYLKYSDDTPDKKADIFESYREQLLKMEGFSNDNLLKDNFKYSLPQTERDFNKCARHYDRKLKCVGLKIVPDTAYSKYHLCEDNRFTEKKFGKLVDPTMQRYLKLRAKHHKEFLSTGYLGVSTREMNSRIADYENFMNANQSFRDIKEVQDWLYCYTIGYIFAGDREDMRAIRHNTFKKSDKRFIRKNRNSKLVPIFNKMISSANGISTNQFNSLYPYEYEKMLNSIRPANGDLDDIFAGIRKDAMKKLANVGYRYVYSTQTNTWTTFNDVSSIGKDCLLLADDGQGKYEVYDNRFKKTNQTIVFDANSKMMIRRGSLLVYSPNSLQISRVEYFYGSFNAKVLSSRAIKEYFPDVLIINVDNIGDQPVQITKSNISQSYMLISRAGSNFSEYQLTADGPMTIGSLNNIFTISSSDTVTVQWAPANGSGQTYNISFVSNLPQTADQENQNEQPDQQSQNNNQTTEQTNPLSSIKQSVKQQVKPTVKQVKQKPVTKTNKPALKPMVKPTVRPVARPQAPASNQGEEKE